jgi:hypothetical protein
MAIEEVIDDSALGVGRPPVHRITASDAHRLGVDVGTVFPLQGVAFLGEVKGIEHIGVRGNDVQGIVHHQWLPFMPPEHARREGPDRTQALDALDRDLLKPAITGIGIVFCGHRPLPLWERLDRVLGAGRDRKGDQEA